MNEPCECQIREIDRLTARSLVTRFHYLGAKPFRCETAYGLFDGENCVGAAVFHGLSAPETAVGAFGLRRDQQQGLWELERLVLDPRYNGSNYTSRLLGKSLKQLKHSRKAKAVITYADSSKHNGGIYRACNFVGYGLTTHKKDFYVDGKIQERGKTKGVRGEWKPRPQKHRFAILWDKELFRRMKWKAEPQ